MILSQTSVPRTARNTVYYCDLSFCITKPVRIISFNMKRSNIAFMTGKSSLYKHHYPTWVRIQACADKFALQLSQWITGI
jgi:hypothetical protein